MLYVLHGSDSRKSREKLHVLVKKLLLKKPNASYFRVDDENFSEAKIEEYIGSQGLFESKYIVLLDKLLENRESGEVLVSRAGEIADSENIFILLEEEIHERTLKILKRHAEKVQEFSLSKQGKSYRFNVFSVTDAFGGRSKKKLWTLYHKAIRSGVAAEELHGILFWQVKTMLLVDNNDTEGMKQFVVGKARKFLRNYSTEELKKLSSQLVSIYQGARRGAVELDIALESFVLGI